MLFAPAPPAPPSPPRPGFFASSSPPAFDKAGATRPLLLNATHHAFRVVAYSSLWSDRGSLSLRCGFFEGRYPSPCHVPPWPATRQLAQLALKLLSEGFRCGLRRYASTIPVYSFGFHQPDVPQQPVTLASLLTIRRVSTPSTMPFPGRTPWVRLHAYAPADLPASRSIGHGIVPRRAWALAHHADAVSDGLRPACLQELRNFLRPSGEELHPPSLQAGFSTSPCLPFPGRPAVPGRAKLCFALKSEN